MKAKKPLGFMMAIKHQDNNGSKQTGWWFCDLTLLSKGLLGSVRLSGPYLIL